MQSTTHAPEAATGNLPVEERVRQRAYELYVERGNESGSELDDWIQAEEETLEAGDQEGDLK